MRDLSDREIELFIEGQQDAREWHAWMLAWLVAHTVNVHVARGRRLEVKDLVAEILPPERARPRAADGVEDAEALVEAATLVNDPVVSARRQLEAAKAKARRGREKEEAKIFWSSPAGAKMRMVLGEDEVDP